MARLQGGAGLFWGHNAIVRTRAWAGSCGLPELAGPQPFGRHILTLDVVEAALLARNGWIVRLDPDLGGSYEEGPENLIEHAKRDRRWCQGNLQHARAIAATGLPGWSRLSFGLGIMAYVAPVFWAGFLISSLLDRATLPPPDHFPDSHQFFPVFPSDETAKAIGLAIGIVGPMILAPLIIAWTSRSAEGSALFATAEEIRRPAILSRHDAILAAWGQPGRDPSVTDDLPHRGRADA